MAVSWTVVASDPSLAHRVLPGSILYTMEEMYAQDFDDLDKEGLGQERQDRQDAAMAGFYVRHNTSIAFQCFALGFFLGLGTIYVLLSNGIQLGTVAGYVLVPWIFDYYTKLGFSPAHNIHKIHALRRVSASSALSSLF